MKIILRSVFIVALMLSSCRQSKHEKTAVPKPHLKANITEYHEFDKKFRAIFGRREELPKSLNIKKLKYLDKTIFVYKYEYYVTDIDSVFFFRDSVKFNSEKLTNLDQRILFYQGKHLKIVKYYYQPKDKLYTVNLFVNDSLGIITSHVNGQSRVIGEYNTEDYNELHKLILQDKLFFKFQTN